MPEVDVNNTGLMVDSISDEQLHFPVWLREEYLLQLLEALAVCAAKATDRYERALLLPKDYATARLHLIGSLNALTGRTFHIIPREDEA